jgi:uncharacterized protein YajQ (UPF0234 family)
MPSFDVSSEINWQSMDDAVNQCLKEIINRFDFKGIKVEIEIDKKEKAVRLFCSESHKMDSVKEVFHQKLIKRGISLLAIEYKGEEKSGGSGAKEVATVAAGVSKEKGKEIINLIKDNKDLRKVQAQIQDEKLRVSAKSRDDLQEVIAFLKEQESKISLPLQFGNFRE